MLALCVIKQEGTGIPRDAHPCAVPLPPEHDLVDVERAGRGGGRGDGVLVQLGVVHHIRDDLGIPPVRPGMPRVSMRHARVSGAAGLTSE